MKTKRNLILDFISTYFGVGIFLVLVALWDQISWLRAFGSSLLNAGIFIAILSLITLQMIGGGGRCHAKSIYMRDDKSFSAMKKREKP